MALHDTFGRFMAAVRSRRGRDSLMFLLFIGISAILWMVLSLNEEEQFDVRLPMKITHVPDSVMLLSPGPEAFNVSLRARGTQVIRMHAGVVPTMNIDFRAYRSNGLLHLNATELKSVARNALGNAQVSVVFPDSLSIPYTTHPGFPMAVNLDYKVTTGPQFARKGRPRLSSDSVLVYMAPGKALPDNYHAVTTEPIRMTGMNKNVSVRVRLVGPPDSRVVPDSIDVSFEVEPLIFKSRKVVIEPVNVPAGTKLITFPAQVDVFYMIPMSDYPKSDPRFRIVADYRSVNPAEASKKMKLTLLDVPPSLQNVHLSADSAEYIIERLR